MKLVELKCKNCGATLKVNPEENEITCRYCQTSFKLDDEIKHIKFDDMEQNGYEFEKGRIRAQEENKNNKISDVAYSNVKKKNNKMLWLVLAWIFLFPFTATYFIAKSEKLDKKKKIIIIAVIWILFLIIGWTGNSQEIQNKKDRITKCYSVEIYNKLDELIGIDNINGNFDDTYTCEKLELKDKNYKKIDIIQDETTGEYTIKVGEETLFSGNIEKEHQTITNTKKETPKNKYAEDDVVNNFITLYNGSSLNIMTDIEKGNIRTKYYGKVLGHSVEMINANSATAGYFSISIYGSNDETDIDNIISIYKDMVKITDNSISSEKVEESAQMMKISSKMIEEY